MAFREGDILGARAGCMMLLVMTPKQSRAFAAKDGGSGSSVGGPSVERWMARCCEQSNLMAGPESECANNKADRQADSVKMKIQVELLRL
jgi:hypothetical protein